MSATLSFVDLGTDDVAAARAFYAALFGWTYDGELALLEGRVAARIAPLNEMQRKLGAPPHWTCHVAVDDVDAVALKARAAGATIMAGPFDVGELGRMAAIDDATGAGVVAWQPKKLAGSVKDRHGALTWADLLTRDVETARRTWTSVFDWTTESLTMQNGAPYTVFRDAGCGMMKMPSRVPAGVPSHFLPYFLVRDCKETLDEAVARGGRAIVPMMEARGVGRFATLADPRGAVFAIITRE